MHTKRKADIDHRYQNEGAQSNAAFRQTMPQAKTQVSKENVPLSRSDSETLNQMFECMMMKFAGIETRISQLSEVVPLMNKKIDKVSSKVDQVEVMVTNNTETLDKLWYQAK